MFPAPCFLPPGDRAGAADRFGTSMIPKPEHFQVRRNRRAARKMRQNNKLKRALQPELAVEQRAPPTSFIVRSTIAIAAYRVTFAP